VTHDLSIWLPATKAALVSVMLISLVYRLGRALDRRHRLRRLHVRRDDLHAARSRRTTLEKKIASNGPGLVVWASEEDAAWHAWKTAAPRPQAIPRLAEHVSALHAKSGRLLATAEGAGCDAAFVESLAGMDRHLAGLLAAVTRPR
jgi:hypothetical protein